MGTQPKNLEVTKGGARDKKASTDRGKDALIGPWDQALDTLREWDPQLAQACFKMTANPWFGRVLPRKLVALIGVAINAACTNLNPEGTRRHIRAALEEGATRDEILFVLKCASVLSIHSCSLGAPISSWRTAARFTPAASCPRKTSSFLSIAFDASYTHMCAPGVHAGSSSRKGFQASFH
ncbi:MAG TPA: carboxymuconolactone decarboxylase family protein [Candidatus Sulfotelmatobacter sp.]|nr:carboxymuconolactone decarboxylase family protein [Candidatus Sulfotelmatobacter sp.]